MSKRMIFTLLVMTRFATISTASGATRVRATARSRPDLWADLARGGASQDRHVLFTDVSGLRGNSTALAT